MADALRFEFSRTLLHSLLSVFVPFWFFLMILTLFADGLLLPGDVEIFPPLYVLLMLLAGTVEATVSRLLPEAQKRSILPRLRELVLLEVIAVFLILLLHGDVGRRDFNIGRVRIWLPTLLLGGQWFLSLYLHRLLGKRERFLKFFEDKETEESVKIYRAHVHEGSQSFKALESAKRLMITLASIGFLACLVARRGSGIQFSVLSSVIVLLFFLSFTLVIATLNRRQSEQLLMADGCVVRRNQKRFRMIAAVSLILSAFLIAVPLAGSRPPLSRSYLGFFLGWLERLGGIEFENRLSEPPVFSLKAIGNRIDAYLNAVNAQRPESSERFTGIGRVAGWTILGGIGAAAALFLMMPLFRGGTGKVSARGVFCRIAGVILNACKVIGAALGRLAWLDRLAWLRRLASPGRLMEERKSRRNKERWRRLGASVTSAAGGPATHLPAKTRIHRGKMRKAFFKFAKWGQRRGVDFSYNSGPLEYALKVSAAVPDRAEECREIASRFEEAMYSNHEMKDDCSALFSRSVNKMTRNG